MCRIRWITVLMLLVPQVSFALQLRWSSGSPDLTVSQDSLAVLIVEADSSEVTLPGSWRLQWTADSSGIHFVTPDSLLACLADTAKVSAIDAPLTPADSVANQITAHFCSDGAATASIAYWVLDLISGSKGKLKVVALDPTDPDSSRVIESNRSHTTAASMVTMRRCSCGPRALTKRRSYG